MQKEACPEQDQGSYACLVADQLSRLCPLSLLWSLAVSSAPPQPNQRCGPLHLLSITAVTRTILPGRDIERGHYNRKLRP